MEVMAQQAGMVEEEALAEPARPEPQEAALAEGPEETAALLRAEEARKLQSVLGARA
jgi:hypothetical protein